MHTDAEPPPAPAPAPASETSSTPPPPPAAAQAAPSEPSSDLAALEAQISVLAELSTRVEAIRQTPAYLRPGAVAPATAPLAGNAGPATQAALLRQGFQGIKQFAEKVQSEPVQDVLKRARESEAQDKTDLSFHHPRKNLKRDRRQPSPESPQPYRSLQPKASLFPADAAASAPLRLDDLVDYIRSYNKTNAHRLHVWTATPRPTALKLPSELTVRFTIRDVVTIYLALGTAPPESVLVVEGATAFGPREKKPPHSQSSYVVFQRLSQHLAKMLQSRPQASLQLVMVLLASYEDLFVRRCSACQRVTSAEGHLPPVARVWVPGEREGEDGHWDARHPACLQA